PPRPLAYARSTPRHSPQPRPVAYLRDARRVCVLGAQAFGGGGHSLVGGHERDAYVARAGRAVEIAWGDEDAEAREGLDGVPAGLVAGGPEVQARLGMVDAKAVRLECGLQHGTPPRVPFPLPQYVLVVPVRGDHRGLH